MRPAFNATITAIRLGIEREFALTLWVDLDFGNSTGQAFGGACIGGVPGVKAGLHHEQRNIAAEYIVGVLRAAGCDDMSKLVGRNVRVRCDEASDKIVAIGHITKEDRWFTPAEAFKRLQM